jgi:hydrogenase nickel incorporation protein HypA/HybF
MHELAIVESIMELVENAAAGQRVLKVTVDVGLLTCVSPEALSFGFSLLAEGTPADGAEFEIRRVPGDQLNVKSIEVEGTA